MQNETQVIREVTNVKLQLLSNSSTTEEFMLVSVLPFRRTRCKSHLRADFIIPLHDGLGPLATAWSCQSIPSSHGAAHGVIFLHSSQDSAALLNRGMLRDWGLLWKWLNQKEMKCPHLEFGRSDGKLVTWLIVFLLGWESMKMAHHYFSLWSHHTSHAWW